MQDICFDIETIPQQEEFNEGQKAFLARKIEQDSIKYGHDLTEKQISTILSVSPYLCQIVCICVYEPAFDKEHTLVSSEESMLKGFWKILGQSCYYDGTFIGYNQMSFDVNIIGKASRKHNIVPTNRAFFNMVKFRTKPHWDVAQVECNWGGWGPMVKLDLVAQTLGLPSSKDKMSGEDVYKFYQEGKIGDIADYCMKDVKTTHLIKLKQENYS